MQKWPKGLRCIRELHSGYVLSPPQDALKALLEILNPQDSQSLVGYLDDHWQFAEREKRYREVHKSLLGLYGAKNSVDYQIKEELWSQLECELQTMRLHAAHLRHLSCALTETSHKILCIWFGSTSIERLTGGLWSTYEGLEHARIEAKALAEQLDHSPGHIFDVVDSARGPAS